MIGEHYNYIASNRKTRYLFESVGTKGRVLKMIVFSHVEGNLWNLGFGDLKKGRLDDASITNNNDVVRVLATVAKAIYEFSGTYPDKAIRIRPVDEKRRRLYNLVFQRRFPEIRDDFSVLGILKNEKEMYSPEKHYDSFEISRKFEP